jgi:hypothetical protein
LRETSFFMGASPAMPFITSRISGHGP